MNKPLRIHECAHLGVSGTTKVHCQKQEDGTFECRIGIAILGATNMKEEGFARADNNPFHALFHDNWASGVGATEEAALEALRADMKVTSDSLWGL